MKQILVPCDFSKPAINAFCFALTIAAETKGTIHLLHVIQLPIMHDTVMMPTLNFEQELLKELKEKSAVHFEKMEEKYNTDKIKVSHHVLFGTTSFVIVDFIKNNSIDLVVMGSHGASGLREVFVGSN